MQWHLENILRKATGVKGVKNSQVTPFANASAHPPWSKQRVSTHKL